MTSLPAAVRVPLGALRRRLRAWWHEGEAEHADDEIDDVGLW